MVHGASSERFWQLLAALVADFEIVIDRPKGSRHPRYPDRVYVLDYGYLRETVAGDNAGIDIWIGSCDVREITGIICSVDTEKRDTEIKVLLGCTEADIAQITAFHNQGDQAAIAIIKPAQTDQRISAASLAHRQRQ